MRRTCNAWVRLSEGLTVHSVKFTVQPDDKDIECTIAPTYSPRILYSAHTFCA